MGRGFEPHPPHTIYQVLYDLRCYSNEEGIQEIQHKFENLRRRWTPLADVAGYTTDIPISYWDVVVA